MTIHIWRCRKTLLLEPSLIYIVSLIPGCWPRGGRSRSILSSTPSSTWSFYFPFPYYVRHFLIYLVYFFYLIIRLTCSSSKIGNSIENLFWKNLICHVSSLYSHADNINHGHLHTGQLSCHFFSDKWPIWGLLLGTPGVAFLDHNFL